jgi:Fe-S-cluster containining protein
MFLDLVDRYRTLLQGADDWFDRCREAAGAELRCASGCSECCRSLFDITLLDALLLQAGLAELAPENRRPLTATAGVQLARLQERWPGFSPPFLLNDRPEAEWEIPEEDDTPCPLLGSGGRCALYAHRPLTCRLHGLPQIDIGGEIFLGEGCTLNGPLDPRQRPELRGEFRHLFTEEARLLRELALRLGKDTGELDTFICAAILLG